VRERFSWGEVSRTPDSLDWGKYQTVADAYHAEGVRVYQIFHDSPWWTREQGRESLNVADLREFYRVTKAAAEHFSETIQAWEVWNEPDISFFPDLADRFAGIQKACYLGLKAGNPEAPVLQGSFCRGLCRFDEALYEQGTAPYYDVFNWHIYNTPESYAGALDSYRGLLSRYGVEPRPIWLTEAGISPRRGSGWRGPRATASNTSTMTTNDSSASSWRRPSSARWPPAPTATLSSCCRTTWKMASSSACYART